MKKLLSLVLSLVLLLSVCSVCAYADDEQITLTAWTFLNPADATGRGKVLANAIAKYEEMYPNVKIQVESIQYDKLTAKFFAAHQAGNAPDIIWLNGGNLGAALAQDTLEPFENLFLKDWTDEQKADIEDVRWKYGTTVDGNHYQLHLSVNSYGLLYRTDLFEKRGVKVEDIQTWDDLLEAAQKLTFFDEETGIQVYGLGVGYSESAADASYLRSALFTEYGNVVGEDGRAIWDNEFAAQALQMQIDMIDKYGVTPASAISQSSEDMYGDFCAGKYAIVFGGSVRVPTVKSQCAFDPNVIQLMKTPDMNGKNGRDIAAGWNVSVWSGSKHKEEAGKFIEVLCSPEIDQEWVMLGGQIPLLKSTIDACAEYLADPANVFLAKASDMLVNNNVTYDPMFSTTGYAADLNRAMQLAYVGGYTPAEALHEVAEEFNERNLNQ